MSGLLLIAEFKNWTIEETAEAWTLDAGVQYALGLSRKEYVCERTVDNYRRLVRDNVDVQEIFTTVTTALVDELQADIGKQRLDSTHVLSQMARLGRQQLLAVTVKRFLKHLEKNDPQSFEAVGEELRSRYEPAESRLFGFGTKQAEPKEQVLQQVAEDLAWLVDHFAQAEAVQKSKAYEAMARVLREHCEVREKQTVVNKQSRDENGGSTHCLQNPSDPEAGYSGHKGAGYQVQLAQALPSRDEQGKVEGPGLIVGCVPQSAAVRDSAALREVIAQQQAAGLLPEQTSADAIYGSDENVQECAQAGVTLISPVCGVAPSKEAPRHNCTKQELERKARLAARRAEQETPEWKQSYAPRSGIEGLHRALDATTGMKKLRVRGARAVAVAVTLKVTGWNIRAAAKTLRQRARRARGKGGPSDLLALHAALPGRSCSFSNHRSRRRRSFPRNRPFAGR